MDANELLTTRSSMPRLVDPGPSVAQLDLIRQAAIRVPDHMKLQPYQFIEFAGKDRALLGDIYQQAAQMREFDSAQIERAGQLPFRSPLIIVSLLKHQPHDKVPWQEQFATVACSTMAMQQACFAQGLGAIWRTGWLAEDDYVREQLGCDAEDEIVGFLYVGTAAVPTPIKPTQEASQFFHEPNAVGIN